MTTLRESPRFHRATKDGRCWNCGGLVALFDNSNVGWPYPQICFVAYWNEVGGSFVFCNTMETLDAR